VVGASIVRICLTILALLATGMVRAAPPEPPARLPLTAFAELPFVNQPEISPDGTRLAGLLAVGGTQRITMISLFNKEERTVAIAVPDGTQAIWVRWVNDDNIIAGLVALLPVESEKFYVSRVIAINRTTGKMTKLLWNLNGQNVADILWVPTDGSSEILMAGQATVYSNSEGFWPAVYQVDVVTGRNKQVVKGQNSVMDWSADATGTVRAGYGYVDSNRTSRLLYRQSGKSIFHTVDRADLKQRETLTAPFLFLPGGDHGLVMHDDDKGQTAIYEVDLATQQEVKQVYAPKASGEVASVILSSDETTLLGVRTTAAAGGVDWLDPKLAEIQVQFDKAVPNASATIESLNKDRTRMLVRVNAPDMPGSIYFYDIADGTLRRIALINEKLGAKHLSPVKLVHYKARDGLDIEAVLTLPAGRDPKKLPFIVMPHGGPWAQDTLSYDYWAQFLANRGYVVLQPNFRGSSGYGTEFLRKGEGQMGLAMQDDITDGVKWMVAQGIADPKRVCIVGASYGGYASMWGVIKEPDLYRCAISISGVSSLRREVNDFGSYLQGGLYRDQWQRMTPDFAAASPINAIDRITVPLMLIHGRKDVTVDHSQSVKMYAAMQKAGKPVEFVSIPLADHYFTRQEDRVTLLTSMESFLDRHNPPD
jgi:dipeptidyl aminopeptidase/acylaminoacyl peptidase